MYAQGRHTPQRKDAQIWQQRSSRQEKRQAGRQAGIVAGGKETEYSRKRSSRGKAEDTCEAVAGREAEEGSGMIHTPTGEER